MCSCVTSHYVSLRLVMHQDAPANQNKPRRSNKNLCSGDVSLFFPIQIKSPQHKKSKIYNRKVVLSATKLIGLLDEFVTRKFTCPPPGPALRSGRRRSWRCAPCSCRRCRWRRWPTRTATHRGSRSRRPASADRPSPPRSFARGRPNRSREGQVGRDRKWGGLCWQNTGWARVSKQRKAQGEEWTTSKCEPSVQSPHNSSKTPQVRLLVKWLQSVWCEKFGWVDHLWPGACRIQQLWTLPQSPFCRIMSEGNMLLLHSHYVLFQLSQSFSLLQCDWLCCFPQSRPLTVFHHITASFKRCSAAVRLQNQQQAQSNNFYRFKQPVTPQTNRPGFCRLFFLCVICHLNRISQHSPYQNQIVLPGMCTHTRNLTLVFLGMQRKDKENRKTD